MFVLRSDKLYILCQVTDSKDTAISGIPGEQNGNESRLKAYVCRGLWACKASHFARPKYSRFAHPATGKNDFRGWPQRRAI